jgi:hypothetical protein
MPNQPRTSHDGSEHLASQLDALGSTLPMPEPGARYIAQVRRTRTRRRVRAVVGLASSVAGVAALALLAVRFLPPARAPQPSPSDSPITAKPAPEISPARAFDWRARLRGGDWILPEANASGSVANPSFSPSQAPSLAPARAEPEPLRARDVQQVIDELDAMPK